MSTLTIADPVQETVQILGAAHSPYGVRVWLLVLPRILVPRCGTVGSVYWRSDFLWKFPPSAKVIISRALMGFSPVVVPEMTV